MARIYVASSWRNPIQQDVVRHLRFHGHEVYDFRNPKPGDNGFHWSEIDPEWKSWDSFRYINALQHPIAQSGFQSDFGAMNWADTCVLVLPCGRSAHLEAGWFTGKGKRTAIFLHGELEPELMYLQADLVTNDITELTRWLAAQPAAQEARDA